MKRIYKIILALIVIFSFNINANAQTLGDLKKQLADYEAAYKKAQQEKQESQNRIYQINDKTKELESQIADSEEKIDGLNIEIEKLEVKAEEKEDQIKEIISFIQITDSENSYLEYLFGAKTVEDLILRSAVSQQLLSYNDELITEYNNTIEECKTKTNELQTEIIKLADEQDQLKTELVTLGDKIEDADGIMSDYANEIEAQKKAIAFYETICKDDEDINKCSKIPYSAKMIRPITSGYITSEYGMRLHPTKKVYTMHSGLDMSGSTTIYPVAAGTVVGISLKNSCGGNMLFIGHNIGGTYYTSAYYHLYTINVKVGDSVDVNTPIAVMGGNSKTPWDTCSTGTHLHLSIAKGLYMKEYTSWSTYTSKLINPRSLIDFPAKGKYFSKRS